MSKRNATRLGFSLVELLISTALALIIGSSIIMLLVSQTQLTATQNRNMINAEEVRGVLTFMADEVQMMGNGVPEPLIAVATIDDFVFYGDIDNNGIRDRIRYFRTGNSLNRSLSTSPDGITWTLVGTDTLIPNLLGGNAPPSSTTQPGLRFEYFGINNAILGTAPPDLAQIRAVRIYAGLDTTATTTAFTRGKVSQQNMVAYATIRNRDL